MAIDAGYTITPLSGSGIQVQYSSDGETWHATFTDGDVYMRQKIDGGDWTDPIKIVGEDGKNAVVMTSATTPSGEYEGQVGIWQNQIYFWTNEEWVNQTPELPTDAVLHYSFDEVPDYPDGSANVRLLDNNTYDIQSGDYRFYRNTNSTTLSNNNGNLQIDTNQTDSFQWSVYLNYTYTKNKIIKLKFEITSLGQGVYVELRNGTGYSPVILGIYDKVGTYEIALLSYSISNYRNFYICTNTGTSTIIIKQIYIGDGSYSTPIIDNANGQNNANNHGGLAVQGVSGKALKTYNAKYVDMGDYYLNDDFTVSIWVNPNNDTSGLVGEILRRWSHFILRNSDSWGNSLQVYVYFDDGTNQYFTIGNPLTPNVWTNLVVSKNNNKLCVYKNTEKIQEYTLNGTKLARSSTSNLTLSSADNTRPQSYDDLLIFDRALSETEVLALYQNKANTPKYFTMSDFSLEQIDDDNVVDHLTEKPQLLSKWLEIYNAKNVSSALPTSNISTNGEYKGVINTANEVGVISTEQLENYIQATNALRSALWGTNGYLVDMNTDSTLNGNLDSLFANYRETLQIARTQITLQQASIASALSVVNSNPFQLIPVDSQGVVITGGYDNTGTRLQVFNGTTILTPKSSSATLSNGEWKVTANGSGIVAGSQTVGTGDNKYIDFGNVSNLTAESAVITYTINVMLNNTPNTIYVVQKFGKSKEGADGRIYTLLPDYTAVKKSADGSVLTPSSVTVQAKSWTGSSIPELYGEGDLKAFENNVQVGTTVHGNSITVTPTGNYPVVVNLYRHGTNTLIDTVTIPILQEVKGDTGRGLVSSVEKYKLSASFTEPFNESTASSWTDTASSVPTAQLPYLHHAVLQTYSEAPLNEYGDDVIIREYVTNGTNGTSTRYSSVSATSSTTSIALNTITGNTAVVGDVIIANSLLFVVTAVGSTNATVQYKQSIKGADNKSVTVLLSNQNPNVTSNSDGTSPVLTNTVTDIRVYENETELKYDASSTSNGYYKVTVTVSGCTHSSITDKGDYAQVNAISAMSADNATRTFAISGKRSDGTTFSFSAVQTITKSKKGNKGDTGVGITAVTEYYLRNNSSTAPAFDESTLSNWSTSASNPISTAQYLWNAERITKSDGTTTTYEYMTPHLAMKYTANGTDGKGIVSIKNYYLASSLDSGVTTETQGWTEAVQTVSSTNRYLWNYEEITYTTGNPTKTSPAIIGTFGAVSQGNWTASHSYKVSDIVYYQGSSYICRTAHTSGSTFDSSKWNKLADKGETGNYTKRIPLYYVNDSATTPNAPTTRVTSTIPATDKTWTQGKYNTYSVGEYYFTCDQIETYNDSGTYQSSAWSTVVRDTEYENASVAKLRSAGQYKGTKSASFTAYTGSDNWDWFLATANFTQQSVSIVAGNVYVWNGSTWTRDTDISHLSASMKDMMALVDSYTSGSTDIATYATVLAQTLAVQQAFINKLMLNKLKLVTDGQSVGAIYGGKYNADGSIDTEATTDKGVYLDADGNFKASNGQFSGVVQDEKGFSYFNELLYEITVVNKTTQETSYYENLTYEQFLAYLNNSQYSTRQLGVKILNNGIEVFSLSQGQYIPQSYKIYSTNNILYVPTEDDYVGFSPADEFPSNNYIWIKYYQSNKLRSVEKLSRTRGYGYKLTSDGRAEFYDDVIIDGDLYLFGKEILKKARYDNDRHRYVNICSDDYDYNQGKGFNFGYDGSNNSYADINNLNVRNISGWKKSNETYSKITFDANNFAFNGQRTYTNITANSYSPSSSSSQRSALFDKIASIYDKTGGGYTHLGFMFGYNQSGTQQVIFSGSIYRIEKASSTTYRVHIYDEFGQTQENYLAVTSSSCIIRTEASGSQVSSSVSTVKFVSIN